MAKRKAKQKPRKRAPRGQIGPQTYEQVRQIVADKKVPMIKAFEEVAKATGRKPGTVAVTYYRIARRHGGGRRRGSGPRRGRPARVMGGGIQVLQRLKSRVTAVIQELEDVIAGQAREIARLKGASRLADRIRKALRE